MNEAVKMDRSADRNRIQAQMDEYARHGGLISKLDTAGNLVGLESVKPSAKILPFKRPAPAPKPAPVEVIQEAPLKLRAKPTIRPAETLPEWCARLTTKPVDSTVIVDTVPELRRIRDDAKRALARLNAAFAMAATK